MFWLTLTFLDSASAVSCQDKSNQIMAWTRLGRCHRNLDLYLNEVAVVEEGTVTSCLHK